MALTYADKHKREAVDVFRGILVGVVAGLLFYLAFAGLIWLALRDPIVEQFEDGSYITETGSHGCLPGYPCND